jgi:hypothetical protein
MRAQRMRRAAHLDLAGERASGGEQVVGFPRKVVRR